MEYTSVIQKESSVAPGVSYSIARVSFGRRAALLGRIRDLVSKVEFLEAGENFREKMEAAALRMQIERLYLEWGLVEVRGLELDGQPATPESLVEKGPEDLSREILAAIKAEFGLTEEERKN
jgi:hypothetical protein